MIECLLLVLAQLLLLPSLLVEVTAILLLSPPLVLPLLVPILLLVCLWVLHIEGSYQGL